MSDVEKTVAVLCVKIDTLQQVVIDEKRRLNGNLERIDKRLIGMDEKLDGVRAESSAKPTWGVSIAITSLVGIVSALGTWALTR
ncbi:MAG: hypothetical protein U1E22_11020 [Coriobacteriia bacterium]|nr:hypothetical protein [Coriobacteriia bacterium]